MIFSNFAYSARNGACQQPLLFCQHHSQNRPKAHRICYTNTLKTTSSVAGRRTHAVSLCRTFAKCRIPHQSLAAKKLSFAERHFPQLCDSDYTETAPVLTSPSLEGAEDTYIIYATTLHADPMSARIDALFLYKHLAGHPLMGHTPGEWWIEDEVLDRRFMELKPLYCLSGNC